ncbi:hypothetical protein [Streptomyces sp. NPDC101234]|uniref:hypothetical protein n=1 Tax=Streptomyces sp. NPDC101234 TaxID=3366138 RepID=UPI003819C8E1
MLLIHIRGRFASDELADAELAERFTFSRGVRSLHTVGCSFVDPYAHGTLFEMLSDDSVCEGAYTKAAPGGRSTPARLVTSPWDTIATFLNRILS